MSAPEKDRVVTCGCGSTGVVETSGKPLYRDLRGEPPGWATLTLSSVPHSRVICPDCIRAVRAVLERKTP